MVEHLKHPHNPSIYFLKCTAFLHRLCLLIFVTTASTTDEQQQAVGSRWLGQALHIRRSGPASQVAVSHWPVSLVSPWILPIFADAAVAVAHIVELRMADQHLDSQVVGSMTHSAAEVHLSVVGM